MQKLSNPARLPDLHKHLLTSLVLLRYVLLSPNMDKTLQPLRPNGSGVYLHSQAGEIQGIRI